jgi:hypothetical protein
MKWRDMNEDGVKDLEEPALEGWTIELWDVGGVANVFLASTTTNAEGFYEFSMLEAGKTYAVCEVLEGGWFETFPDDPTDIPLGESIYDCTQLGIGYGPVGYSFTPVSGDEFLANDFGNDRELGCTLTQGYWKTHADPLNIKKYDDTWDEVGGSDAPFFDTGQSWILVFNTPPSGGNAYYILAHQYMAARLNTLKDENPADDTLIEDDMLTAAALLDYYDEYPGGPIIPKEFDPGDPPPLFDEDDRALAIEIANTLDQFNNGELPGGPLHCDD